MFLIADYIMGFIRKEGFTQPTTIQAQVTFLWYCCLFLILGGISVIGDLLCVYLSKLSYFRVCVCLCVFVV